MGLSSHDNDDCPGRDQGTFLPLCSKTLGTRRQENKQETVMSPIKHLKHFSAV